MQACMQEGVQVALTAPESYLVFTEPQFHSSFFFFFLFCDSTAEKVNV